MCLTTESKRCTLANKPVPCYKVVWKKQSDDNEPQRFKSEYFGFIYDMGKEYSVKPAEDFITKKPEDRMSFSLEIGFHSYGRLKDAMDNCQDGEPWEQVVLRCEIPAGALYWRGNKCLNDKGYIEYCSNRIKITGWRLWGETKWHTNIREEEPCA